MFEWNQLEEKLLREAKSIFSESIFWQQDLKKEWIKKHISREKELVTCWISSKIRESIPSFRLTISLLSTRIGNKVELNPPYCIEARGNIPHCHLIFVSEK